MALSSGDKTKVGSWLTSGQASTAGGYQDVGNRMSAAGQRAGGVWTGAQDWGLGELRGIYDTLAEGGGGGGGVPGYGGELDASKNWWQQIADTGWRTPEQKDAGWGWGNFKEAAKTGLWSPQEMADFRARAASGTPQLYGGIRDEMARGRTVQGGYGPGYNTALAQLARDRSKAIGDVQLGAETSLADSIRRMKQWGSEQGAGAARGELGQMTNAQGQLDSIARQIADMNRAAAASRGASADRDLAMRLGIIDKYTDLARTTGGDIPYAASEMASYGGRTGADTGYAQTYAQTQQKGPSFWDKLLSGAVGAAGAAGGLGWKPLA